MSNLNTIKTQIQNLITKAKAKTGNSANDLTSQVDVLISGYGTGTSSGKTQSKSVNPSETAQVVTPDSGYDALSSVSVGAISKTYIGSSVTKKTAQTYTPSTSNQTIASGQYLSGTQTIKGDTNLVASNIKSGVTIFGKTGTYTGSGGGSGGIDTSDADATADNIEKDKTAYVNGQKITGSLSLSTTVMNLPVHSSDTLGGVSYNEATTGDYIASPETIKINFKPSSKQIINSNTSITAYARADKFGDATPSDVASGKTFTSVNGLKLTGTATTGTSSPKLQTKTVTPSASSQTVRPDSTYDGLSSVTVNGDSDLVAGNIKSGINIFGVTGTYTGSGGTSSGNNNCEAYVIDVTNPVANFKTTTGTIKAWGYAKGTTSGYITPQYGFTGAAYTSISSFGGGSTTNITLSVDASGKITGLPNMASGTVIVTRGV